jgi:succinoglycan biosynthesis transport protein ExoP
MQGWSAPPQESRSVAPSAVAPVSDHSVLTPADFRKVLIKRKWILIVTVVLGLAIGVYHIVTTIPQYEAIARVHIDLSRTANIGIEDLIQQQLAGGGDESDKLQTEIQIMQSETVRMEVINSQDLYRKPPFSNVFKLKPYTGTLTPAQRTALLSTFSGSTKIQVVPNTEMVEIHYRNQDPAVARDVANSIVDAYLDRDLRSRFEGTTRVSNWLSQQLTTVKRQVEDSQQELARYQRQNNLVAMDSQGGNLVTDSLRTVNEQLSEAEADRIVKEARYRMALTRNPDLLVSVAPGTVLGSLRSQQAQLLVEAAQLKAKFGPDFPRVKELDKQLASVQSDIDQEINSLTKRFTEEYDAAVKTQALMQARRIPP